MYHHVGFTHLFCGIGSRRPQKADKVFSPRFSCVLAQAITPIKRKLIV